MQCSEKPILLEAPGTVSPLRRPDSCGFISIKQLSRYIKVCALIWRASERRRASALPSDSRMALHKQSPPGTGSSVRIRRHGRDGLCCMLKVIRRTDGWKTKRWKRESSGSSFTFVFFFIVVFSDFDLSATAHQITIDDLTCFNDGASYNWSDKQPYFIGSEMHIVLHRSSLSYFSRAVCANRRAC